MLVLAIAATLPYVLLPPNPLLLDCGPAILDNEVVREGSIAEFFTTDFWGRPGDSKLSSNSYRPLVVFTFAVQYQLFGDAPSFFHVADMALHVFATLLVAVLLVAVRQQSAWSVPAACVFAVHPVLTDATCSVVGRADMMAVVAMLAGVVLHLGGPTIPWKPSRSWGWVVGLGAAALLSKEYAVVYPFLLVVVGLARWRIAPAGGEQRRSDLLVWSSSFVVLAAYLGARYVVFGEVGGVPMLSDSDHPLLGASWEVRWATASLLLFHAATLVVVPNRLSHVYSSGTLPIVDGFLDPRVLPGIVLVVAFLVGGWWLLSRRRDPRLLLAATFFLFPLGPSLNTVSIAGVLFAERFLYMPAMALSLMLAMLLDRYASRGRGLVVGRVAVAMLIVVFGVMTIQRVDEWSSMRRLAESSIRNYPQHAHSHLELGMVFATEGDDRRALESFARSLELKDDRPQVWTQYGVALMRTGRFEEAAAAFDRAIEHAPGDVFVLWRRKGRSHLLAGDAAAAVDALERAHELQPSDPGSRSSLADALVALARTRAAAGENDDAMRAVERLRGLGRLPPRTWIAAAGVARGVGRGDLSDELVRAALSAAPDLPRRMSEEAAELEKGGRHREAAARYAELLTLQPDHPGLTALVGRALLRAGESAAAIPYLRRSLALRDVPEVRRWLEAAERSASEAPSRATPAPPDGPR